MKKIKKLNCFILIFILTISILFSASFFLCYVSADDIIYQGIDVSEYQGDIDFEQVKNAGIEVVYIRAGEGDSYVDKYFEINSEKIKSTDLNFGYYYYVTATTPQQGAQQAKTFAALIKNKSYNARPVMDFEYFNGMSKDEINEIAVAFMDTLENETSITPMLYTDAYNADTVWNTTFAKYPVWIADYNNLENPPPNNVWKTWDGFQYSDEGEIAGINTRVDLDKFKQTVLFEEKEKIRGSLEVYLTSSTDNPLADGIFTIKDENQNLINTIKTDNSGKAILNNIKAGKYSCFQSQAPSGYAKDERLQYFEIKTNGEIVGLSFVNNKIIIPPTGAFNNQNILNIETNFASKIIIISTFIILLLIVIFTFKKSKSKS